ncbi:MAG: transcription elongation factor subunit Spt4 [Candidatus Hodarchaeales archaeon]|jgi:DNA-directed RNA polymerase subunit E"
MFLSEVKIMKKKACKTCNVIVLGDQCPICKSNSSLSSNFSGLIIILDSSDSEICQKVNRSTEGNYAIRVR